MKPGRNISSMRVTVVLPDRDELYRRCDARFDAMLGNGAIEEVRRLMALGLPADLPIMGALGVESLMSHLRGRWSLDEASLQAQIQTRQYAKRQRTWFRHQLPADSTTRVSPEASDWQCVVAEWSSGTNSRRSRSA